MPSILEQKYTKQSTPSPFSIRFWICVGAALFQFLEMSLLYKSLNPPPAPFNKLLRVNASVLALDAMLEHSFLDIGHILTLLFYKSLSTSNIIIKSSYTKQNNEI